MVLGILNYHDLPMWLHCSFSYFCQNWIKVCLFLVSLETPQWVCLPSLSPCWFLEQFIALATWKPNLSNLQPLDLSTPLSARLKSSLTLPRCSSTGEHLCTLASQPSLRLAEQIDSSNLAVWGLFSSPWALYYCSPLTSCWNLQGLF